MDYLSEVRQIYSNTASPRLPLDRHLTVEAAIVVERLFPPTDTHGAFSILAALNLLNAAVKQPWGRQIVGYQYIKGMAASLFIHLLYHPLPHIHPYHDHDERITYFRAFGVQVSFHYLPYGKILGRLQDAAKLPAQTWDGIRLQGMAVELFRLATPQIPPYTESEFWNTRSRMLDTLSPTTVVQQSFKTCLCNSQLESCNHIAPPETFTEDKLTSLHHALAFNIWESHNFTLFRRKDHCTKHFVRYDGQNYRRLIQKTTEGHPEIPHRPKSTLEVGKYYYASPQMRLRSLSLSNYIFTLSQNNYLVQDGNYSNLCVTYGIALYLASLLPDILFVNILEYNRRMNPRRYYNYDRLRTVPLNSDERRMKVWLIVDTTHQLKHFDAGDLPRPLIDEYLAADDFYQEFQLIHIGSLLGIIAYRRHILLPPLYPCIRIHNYHAHVMRTDGKWAIYSLGLERFVSDFIYDRIWYDPTAYIIHGSIDGQTTVIYAFFPRRQHGKKTKKQ